MSANLTLSWPAGLICVSDRRLIDLVTRRITTNRSTKMTLFACADAYGVIVYNGIGSDLTGATPSDWIMELAAKKAFDSAIGEVLQAIGADLESRLRPIRAKYGASRTRHTFFVPVWQAGVPVVHAISNYERADQRGEQPKGTEQVTHSSSTLSKELPIQITTSGSYPFRRDLKAISAALKAAASLDRLKALCVKAVKDIAYGKNKARGSVGASCQWAFVGPNQDHVWIALDVVGGTAAQELPNLINITAQVPLGGTFSMRLGGPGRSPGMHSLEGQRPKILDVTMPR